MAKCVLFVSDSLYRRNSYLTMLQQQGYIGQAVAGGVAALQSLYRNHFDLIVLETTEFWGGSDGLLDVRASDERLKAIPVIVVSVGGLANHTYQLSQYNVQGFFFDRPSAQQLARSMDDLTAEQIACSCSAWHLGD